MEEGFQRKPGRDDRDPGCRWYNWGRHSGSPDGEDIPEDSWRKDSSRTWRSHGLCGPGPEHGRSTSIGRGRDSEGHMSLHARNIAAMAGAQGDLIDLVADKMVSERKIRLDRARELLLET